MVGAAGMIALCWGNTMCMFQKTGAHSHCLHFLAHPQSAMINSE